MDLAAVRRTQARQVELQPDVPLAQQACRQCRLLGLTIVAMGRNDNGAIELGWCSVNCARLDGWPFLRSERDHPRDERQVELFGLDGVLYGG